MRLPLISFLPSMPAPYFRFSFLGALADSRRVPISFVMSVRQHISARLPFMDLHYIWFGNFMKICPTTNLLKIVPKYLIFTWRSTYDFLSATLIRITSLLCEWNVIRLGQPRRHKRHRKTPQRYSYVHCRPCLLLSLFPLCLIFLQFASLILYFSLPFLIPPPFMLPTSICLSLFLPSSLHFGWCGHNEKLQKMRL